MPTNWLCLKHLGTDRVESTASIIAAFSCCRGNMLVYGAVAYQWPLYSFLF
jgi:hypothetical protein